MFFEAFQQSGQHVEILCRAGCGDDGADRTADGLHVSQGRSEADPAEFGEEFGEFFCCVFLRVLMCFPEGVFSTILREDWASCLPGRAFVCCGACWYLRLSQRGLI